MYIYHTLTYVSYFIEHNLNIILHVLQMKKYLDIGDKKYHRPYQKIIEDNDNR